MKASYEGSEILNQFPIKLTQFLYKNNIIVQIAALSHYLLVKSVLPLLLTLTYQFQFFCIHPVTLFNPHKIFIHPGLNHSPFQETLQ